MDINAEYQAYVDELRASVCSLCVARPPGGPPCAPLGRNCGIEQHVPELVEICRTTPSMEMEPFIEQLHNKICATCDNRGSTTCPCPLDYLLQLAVEAVQRVERRRVGGLVIGDL